MGGEMGADAGNRVAKPMDISMPDGFLWSVKAHRSITHIKRLRDVGEPLERFLKSFRALGDKLGPLISLLFLYCQTTHGKPSLRKREKGA
jgi:hypothetical protein